MTETVRMIKQWVGGWQSDTKWLIGFAAVAMLLTALWPYEQEVNLPRGYEIVDGSREEFGDWRYSEFWIDGQKMPIAATDDRESKGSFVQVFCRTDTGFFQAGINFRQKLGYGMSKHTISYWLDEIQAVTDEWLVVSIPGNNQEQLLQKGLIDEYGYDQEGAYMLALDLADHNRLQVRAHNIDGVTLERTFSLHGSRKLIFRVLRTCGLEVE